MSVASLRTEENISKQFPFGIIYRKLLYISLHYFLKSPKIIIWLYESYAFFLKESENL